MNLIYPVLIPFDSKTYRYWVQKQEILASSGFPVFVYFKSFYR